MSETHITIPAAAALIAADAREGIRMRAELGLGTIAPLQALDLAATGRIDQWRLAKARRGMYKYETTEAVMDELGFIAAVAMDIHDGGINRPSTGNVREYALGLVNAAVTA